jgi:site-specific recombinase XerD
LPTSSGSRDSEDAADRVAAFLRSRSGGSPDTVRTYAKRLARYTQWRGGPGIDRSSYDAYLARIKREGRRPNGIALDARVLLLYADFLKVDTDGWQRVRLRDVPTAWLRENEYEALRRALAGSRRDAEDRVFLLDFLRGTGLRLREFMQLRWRDIDLEVGTVTVRAGKGGRTRVVPIPWRGPPAAARALEAAQQAFWRRHPDRTLAEGRLVGDRVSPWEHQWRVRNFLTSAARRAGLQGLEVHPHILRHCYAVDMTLRGVPQAIVQRLLGHASPATTSRYQQVAPVDIVEALHRAASQDGG